MLVCLPVLMAQTQTGQEFHEWLGTGMLALFLVHQILNAGWWKNLCKGKYTLSRAFGTVIGILLVLDMSALFVSGIMMSGFVFDFLPISRGMAVARQLHMLASHWGLILISVHLGLHMEMFMGIGRRIFRISENNTARAWILRIIVFAGSIYGIYAFTDLRMPDYLFLKAQFIMADESKPSVLYFAENAAVIWLFAAIGHYLDRFLRHLSRPVRKKGPGKAKI